MFEELEQVIYNHEERLRNLEEHADNSPKSYGYLFDLNQGYYQYDYYEIYNTSSTSHHG